MSVFVEQFDAQSGETLWEALTGGTVDEGGPFVVSGLSAGPVLVLEPVSSIQSNGSGGSGLPSQVPGAQGAAAVVSERWVVASYNIGAIGYSDYSYATPQPGQSSHWSVRLPYLVTEMKGPVGVAGYTTLLVPSVLALQEADCAATASVNGVSVSQVDSLLARLGSDYAAAVSCGQLAQVTGDVLPNGTVRPMSRKNQLFYRPSVATVVASGALSGSAVLGDVTSASVVAAYRLALKNRNDAGVVSASVDRVFPWAVLKKAGASNTAGRSKLVVASSAHSAPESKYYGSSVADCMYYNSNIVKGLARRLKIVSEAGKLGNTNYSVGAPAFIGADLNRYYNTYTRGTGVAKSPPKMLSDYGWTDLRYADTGFRQTVHACAVDSTCKKFATIPEGRSVLDYIFAIYDHTWTPGKFTTKPTSTWYSDHKMITGDIWIRG